MKERIINKLKQLEIDKQIKILLAVETGSRAWGFASPDSDFDVRLIYVKDADWYIKLAEGKDHLSYMSSDGELDLTGWELRKALRLMAKSNASLLERIQSPIVYFAKDGFAQEMQKLANEFYSKVAVLHHYMSMAFKSMGSIDGQSTYRLKSLFYALRASCACLWVLENDQNPPIVFTEMLDGITIPDSVKLRISELTKLKSTRSESYLHSGEDELIEFVKDSLSKSKAAKDSLKSNRGEMSKLDEFLRSQIRG